ncbi:MAG: SecY-interacting protein [Gammaproteobacteria bacterium]|nr:SecY-interacting protein [Gammaproteobacteria bacterium]
MPAINTSADPRVSAALDAFIERYLEAFPRLEDFHDPQWRSTCEIAEPYLDAQGEHRVLWLPQRREPEGDVFAGLERALEVPIHPSLKTFYGRYWSGGLEATASEGHVSLLLLWNDEDADRLVENLIGHALTKRRLRQPMSVFFACTEADSELFLSVDNDSGQVLLEAPGRKPLRVVAESLGVFLDGLDPAPPQLHPERPD